MLGRSGIEVGPHPGQVVVDREAAGARALGEQDPLLNVRVKGELKGDGPWQYLAGVRDDGGSWT